MKKICGVYWILNKVNRKRYIGHSIDIHKRWKTHKKNLNNNKHKNRHLNASWNKYGSKAFEFSVVEECDKSLRKELEVYHIDKYNTFIDSSKGYNKTRGGDGTGIGIENHKSIPCNINGVYYESMGIASRELKVNYGCLTRRLRSSSHGFVNWCFCDSFGKIIKKEPKKKNRRRKRCFIDGIYYESKLNASKELGVDQSTVIRRINSDNPKFEKWLECDMDGNVINKKIRDLVSNNARSVIILGIRYNSLKDASINLNVSVSLIHKRVNSPKEIWVDWCYD